MEELEKWQTLATKCTIAFREDAGGGHSFNSDKLEKNVERLIEIEDQLQEEIGSLVITRGQVDSVIAKVENPVYRTLLEFRYRDGMTFQEISAEMGYEYGYVRKLHNHALRQIQEILDQQGTERNKEEQKGTSNSAKMILGKNRYDDLSLRESQ